MKANAYLKKISITLSFLIALLLSCRVNLNTVDPLNSVSRNIILTKSENSCGIKLEIDTVKWNAKLEIHNLSDSTFFIYPRIDASLIRSRDSPRVKRLYLTNFDNHSSIVFPVKLSPVKPKGKILLDIDLSFPRQSVSAFNEFSKVELITNRMFHFKNIDFLEDSLSYRTVSSIKYQAFSRETRYLFDIN